MCFSDTKCTKAPYTKNKKILETLHFDIQPYANGMQKWKTLYSPKITGKPEDEGSVGIYLL